MSGSDMSSLWSLVRSNLLGTTVFVCQVLRVFSVGGDLVLFPIVVRMAKSYWH